MLCKKLWWMFVALTILTTYRSRSSTLAGACQDQRLHAFTVSRDTNGTSLTYMNTGTSEPIVASFENSLPSLSLCGADYERCNALITSNADETIRVVMFPLDSGIALVSFNYSTLNDSLVYRGKFLLPQNEPNCTFIYFVEELIGYCLDLNFPEIRAFEINIDFVGLTASTVHRRDNSFDLMNVATLSNLVYIIRHGFDECFPNEGNHVVFLEGGDLIDHSFMDERISFNGIHIDNTCSRLHRVGGTCRLAAHCDNKVVLFDTRTQIPPTSYTVAEYGQIFFCPTEDFVRFQNKTLTLHDPNCIQFGNSTSFPFGEIHRGYCLYVADKFFFVATIDNGGTILVDFDDTSYRHLGGSDISTVVPAKVEGHFAIVNNGSETDFYNLGLACMPEPLVLPNNFIFVTFFSTMTMDQCQCVEPSPPLVPVTLSVITMMTSESSTPMSPTPTSKPITNSSQKKASIIGAVVGTILTSMIILMVALVLAFICKPLVARIKRMRRSPRVECETEFNPESRLACIGEFVKLNDVNKPSHANQESSTMASFDSQDTKEPLLDSQPRILDKDHILSEIPNLNIGSNKDQLNPQLRPESDVYGPRLDCIEDVLKSRPISEHSVYENHSLSDQDRDDNESTTEAGRLRHGACALTQEVHVAKKDNIPIPCTSPAHSPRGSAACSYQHNGHLFDLPRVNVEGHTSRPTSTANEEGTVTLYVSPVEERSCDCSHMAGVQACNAVSLHNDDVRKVYQVLDGKMNEEGYRQFVNTVVSGDSQSQNSEPNNDDLQLDRQGSNDSQENEN